MARECVTAGWEIGKCVKVFGGKPLGRDHLKKKEYR